MKNYIRGKYANAACDLMDELKQMGIPAAVGYHTPPKKNQLIVVPKNPKDDEQVPAEWRGFKITVQIDVPVGERCPKSKH